MNTSSISPAASSRAQTPTSTVAHNSSDQGKTAPTHGVGQSAQSVSDEELEAHIRDAGERMKDAMARYEVSGCFNDLADGHRWLTIMEDAIKARSPAQVAAMEAEKGLA